MHTRYFALALGFFFGLSTYAASQTLSVTVNSLDTISLSGDAVVPSGDFSVVSGKLEAVNSDVTLSVLTNATSPAASRSVTVSLDTLPTGYTVEAWITGGSEVVGSAGSATVVSSPTALSTSATTLISNMREYSLSSALINYKVRIDAGSNSSASMQATWTISS